MQETSLHHGVTPHRVSSLRLPLLYLAACLVFAACLVNPRQTQAQSAFGSANDLTIGLSLNSNIDILTFDGAIGLVVNPLLSPLTTPLNNLLDVNASLNISGINTASASAPAPYNISNSALGVTLGVNGLGATSSGTFSYSLQSDLTGVGGPFTTTSVATIENLNLALSNLLPIGLSATTVQSTAVATGEFGAITSTGSDFNTAGVDVTLGGISLLGLGLTPNVAFDLSTLVGADLAGLTTALGGLLSGVSGLLSPTNVALTGTLTLVTEDLNITGDGINTLTVAGTDVRLLLDNVALTANVGLDAGILGTVTVGNISTGLTGSVDVANALSTLTPVPEPGSIVLTVIGVALMLRRRK